jgi:hypothetical protein
MQDRSTHIFSPSSIMRTFGRLPALDCATGRASQLACVRFANNAAAEGTLDRRVAGSLPGSCGRTRLLSDAISLRHEGKIAQSSRGLLGAWEAPASPTRPKASSGNSAVCGGVPGQPVLGNRGLPRTLAKTLDFRVVTLIAGRKTRIGRRMIIDAVVLSKKRAKASRSQLDSRHSICLQGWLSPRAKNGIGYQIE